MNNKINNKSFLISLLLLVCNMPLYAVELLDKKERKENIDNSPTEMEKFLLAAINGRDERATLRHPKGVIDTGSLTFLSLKVREKWLLACGQKYGLLGMKHMYKVYGDRIINCANNKGQTGLMVAAYHMNKINIQYLISLKADAEMKDYNGKQAFDWLFKDLKKKDIKLLLQIDNLLLINSPKRQRAIAQAKKEQKALNRDRAERKAIKIHKLETTYFQKERRPDLKVEELKPLKKQGLLIHRQKKKKIAEDIKKETQDVLTGTILGVVATVCVVVLMKK